LDSFVVIDSFVDFCVVGACIFLSGMKSFKVCTSLEVDIHFKTEEIELLFVA